MEVANDLFSLEVRLCYIVGTSVELAVLGGPLKKIEASWALGPSKNFLNNYYSLGDLTT